MANWVYNKLEIKGSVVDMSKFYEVLNSQGNSEFSMQKFFPTPTVLNEDYTNKNFQVCKTINTVGKNGEIVTKKIDSRGRTKEEFQEYKSDLVEKYGHDNSYDWCMDNWGCEWDVDCCKTVKKTDTDYCITYETPNDSNIEFVKWGLKLPNLEYQLNYSGCDFSGTLKVGNEFSICEYNVVRYLFLEEVESKKYMFIKDYSSESYKDTYIYIPILDLNWEKSLLDMKYSKDNIVNWQDLTVYLNSIKLKSKYIYKFNGSELFAADK